MNAAPPQINSPFSCIALFGKIPRQTDSGHTLPANLVPPPAPHLILRLAQWLIDRHYQVLIEQETADFLDVPQKGYSLDEIVQKTDMALVIGGDGTMLSAARLMSIHNIPLLGINQGRLGFMTDIQESDTFPALERILSGDYVAEARLMLEAQVLRSNSCLQEANALNDVVISRGSAGSMIELAVHVNGQFMAVQRADGVIVATATGSTAYALSANGPIIHPAVDGFVLVPVAPHALTNRPIVLPASADIVLEIVNAREASVFFDMHSLHTLRNGDSIHIRRSQYQATFLHPPSYRYFDVLRQKLHWSGSSIS